ncbi:hypothetical protein RIF29_02001 [Crotalaria pallida]|uniref:Uncharacterized protein n=1 Tax=Crotalaria pallida TaxID=3830 RepID=A0AAN9IXY4_CROPI
MSAMAAEFNLTLDMQLLSSDVRGFQANSTSKNQLRNSKTLIHSLRFRGLLRLKGMETEVEGIGEEERGFERVEGDSREWLKEALVMEAEGEGGSGDGSGGDGGGVK